MKEALLDRIYWAWLVALAAVFGFFFYGEVMQVEPCRLCWYQRMCMFPLAILLGVSWYKREKKIARCALPLVYLGGGIALYQLLSELFPPLKISALCSEAVPCALFGYMAFFSLFSFALIGTFIKIGLLETKK